MHILEIGKPYTPGRTDWPRGVEFDWLDTGPALRRFVTAPTEDEVEQFRTGAMEIGLVYAEGIIFLLAKFGTLDWIDAAFHISMVPPDRRPDLSRELSPEESVVIQVHLVDASTGILVVARSVKLSLSFARQLHSFMTEQAKRPMTEIEYVFAVDQAYKNHPVTELTLVRTLTTSKG